MSVPIAAAMGTVPCPNGCTVIILFDADGNAFGCAHIPAGEVEEHVTNVRQAAAESEALQRPPA